MSGLFLANCFSISLWWIFALCAAALCTVGASTFKRLRQYFIVCGCSFVIASVYCAAYTHFVYNDLLSYDGQVVAIDGCITDYNYVGHGQGYITVKGKLGGHTTKISFLVSDDDYEYYDDVSVTGKVVRIKDNYNFQSQSYYFSDGVFLKGEGAASVELKGTNSNALFRSVRKYSDHIFSVVIQGSGYEQRGILGAMLCGDKSEMEPALKNMLYRSGIGHIFAVSGIHLVILTSVIGRLLGYIFKRKRLSAVLRLCIIWAFVVFAGMSVSVTRSAIMMSIVCAGDFFMRRGDSANSLGIAGIVLCLLQPYCVFSASFLLSFTSAFAAGTAAPFVNKRLGFKKIPGIISKGLVFSCVETLCIAPICLIFYGGFSALAPLTNVLLIPLCTCALVLCFIVAFTGGTALIAKPLLWAATMIVKLVIYVVKVISKPALLFVTAPGNAAVVIVSAVCIAIVIFMCLSRKSVAAGGIMVAGLALCVLCSNIFTLVSYDRLEIFVFAHKKNCAVIAVNSDRALIFDLSDRADFTGAQMRVIQHYGVRTTDAVFVESEPYYTISKYKDKLYPTSQAYFSATEIPVVMSDSYEFDTGSSVKIGDLNVTRLENGFELEYNDKKYSFCSDCFSLGDVKYDTNGVSVRFSTDDDKVRRLDYELGFTDYSW